MKGERTLDGKPFRFGGAFEKNYNKDCEEWAKEHPEMRRCFVCGGTMRNEYSVGGKLIKRFFPYMAVFKITKGKKKGKFCFRPLCRACAYDFGRGVVEMDGETYRYYYDFNEEKYKRERGGCNGKRQYQPSKTLLHGAN